MLVKSQIKLIRSLQQKKYRNQHGLFFVEGKKTVNELLDSDYTPHSVFSTDPKVFDVPNDILTEVTLTDLKQMSTLKNPNGVLGIFHIPEKEQVEFKDWIVVLDDIRDPGNLGTIIRLCDWFGIHDLVCSQNTVDCYNPKVLQATMGSISRVNISYRNLPDFLKDSKIPIYGAFMDGVSVYQNKLPEKGIIILGNEGNGISSEVETMVSEKVSIPQYGNSTTESLNVATATAILLNEIRRA
ncbi:RNA methyltransferase [Maribacter algarum]|uniref:RNA methyltransferase n=1 Tax=Maribacter algarum (ex Zhang et al. 2020) TaxID=2578118 RepID=A0A5S3PNV2_9FLAO|nr:RNA methyltransferase [Maribacter algarum]TMM56169.1 RNA methyltransferase [Maribacter algarum]